MESKTKEETKVILEIQTDVRNAPKHLQLPAKLSYLAQGAQLGIALKKEALRAGGNICVVINTSGDFKRIKNYADVKALYNGDDKQD